MGYYDRDRTTAASTMQWPEPHIGSTSEFLVAGWPYTLSYDNATGGTTTNEIVFRYVSKFITITALTSDLSVSIQSGSAFVIPAGTTQKFEVKATTVDIDTEAGAGFRLIAGLTNIKKKHYPDLTAVTQADVDVS